MIRALVALALVLLAVPAAAQQDVVARHRAQYPTPLPPAAAPALLKAIAAELGPAYGLLVKTSGNQCGGFACDIVCRTDGQHWDVLVDGPDGSTGRPGAAKPSWQAKGSIGDRRCQVFAAPSPQPPPPDGDLEALKARLAAIEAWIRSFPR